VTSTTLHSASRLPTSSRSGRGGRCRVGSGTAVDSKLRPPATPRRACPGPGSGAGASAVRGSGERRTGEDQARPFPAQGAPGAQSGNLAPAGQPSRVDAPLYEGAAAEEVPAAILDETARMTVTSLVGALASARCTATRDIDTGGVLRLHRSYPEGREGRDSVRKRGPCVPVPVPVVPVHGRPPPSPDPDRRRLTCDFVRGRTAAKSARADRQLRGCPMGAEPALNAIMTARQ
jgi:hypothetical protein